MNHFNVKVGGDFNHCLSSFIANSTSSYVAVLYATLKYPSKCTKLLSTADSVMSLGIERLTVPSQVSGYHYS